jgi:hypothetical protein
MAIQKATKLGGVLAMAITFAGICFNHPANGWVVFLCLSMAVCLVYAFHDYPSKAPDGFRRFVRWVFLIGVCASVASIWGRFWWQRITVSPSHVSFEGYPNETFNFSVRNERSDDVYDVQVPFLIGYGKHYEDKLSAKVMPNGDPPQALNDDYNYCFGVKGDGVISHVQKNEREVLIIRIRHLAPSAGGIFTITYTGREKFTTEAGEADFSPEPYSYSPMQGTMGVRGDYRICKFAIQANRLDGN